LLPSRWSRDAWHVATRSDFPTSSRSLELPMGIYTIRKFRRRRRPRNPCAKRKLNRFGTRRKYANKRARQISGRLRGLFEAAFRRTTNNLLGVQILGEAATEMILHIGYGRARSGGTLIRLSRLASSTTPRFTNCTNTPRTTGLGNLRAQNFPRGIG